MDDLRPLRVCFLILTFDPFRRTRVKILIHCAATIAITIGVAVVVPCGALEHGAG